VLTLTQFSPYLAVALKHTHVYVCVWV
jgi:hypothetical protein